MAERGRKPKLEAVRRKSTRANQERFKVIDNLGGVDMQIVDGDNPKPPMHTIGPLRAPERMTTEAKKKWRELSMKLQRSGLLTELDEDAFYMYCMSYSLMLDAENHVKEDGPLQYTQAGWSQTSSWETVRRECLKTCLDIARDFGMTPVARLKLSLIGGNKKKSKLKEVQDMGS